MGSNKRSNRAPTKGTGVIAIIPARGGSKRIPRKNIKSFMGKPIIEYSIDVAFDAKCFDTVMVSTDDCVTANVAKKAGAEVPFMRSKKNSSNKATIASAVIEVIREYKKRGEEFEYLCVILATAPMLSASIIKRAFKLLQQKSFVVPVVEFDYPVQRRLQVIDGFVSVVEKENENKRSQDLPPFYHDAGMFVWAKTDALLKNGTFFVKKMGAVVLPGAIVQDIDDEDDWKIAEAKFQAIKKAKNRIP